MKSTRPDPVEAPRATWARAALALGSNLGDRARHLGLAVQEIGALAGVRILAVSGWMETAPVGGPERSPGYLNGALLLETELSARELLDALLEIERAHGRERRPGIRDEPRTLDLDLLVFGSLKMEEPDLHLPHPRMEEREFVLAPLAEIAPDLVLASGRTARQRLAELTCSSPGEPLDRIQAPGEGR
jgi:2-amino-4-hydroxy-6-hydroxymethyldihydropteridine diphosphokinase